MIVFYLDCSGSAEKGSLGATLGTSKMPRHTMTRQRTIDEFVSSKFDLTLTVTRSGFLHNSEGIVNELMCCVCLSRGRQSRLLFNMARILFYMAPPRVI